MLALAAASVFAAPTKNSATGWPAADPEAVARWQALRFGIFIHWGPVSLTSEEIGWSRGVQTTVEVYDTRKQNNRMPGWKLLFRQATANRWTPSSRSNLTVMR